MDSGIARFIYAFGKLTQIEAAISTVIAKSKVPSNEIRAMLKGTHSLQVERTPLFQYMRSVFREIGLGDLKCGEVSDFTYHFNIKNSEVQKLFSNVKGKTCYLTTDAIRMFFEKDLDIPVEVREIKCINDGDDHCEFLVEMNPLGVLKYIVDEEDYKILESLKKGEKIKGDEIRIKNLQRYKLIESGKLTVLGKKYLEIRESPIIGNVERPWKKLSEISEVTASAKSFAEAFSRSIENEVEEVDESKVVDIVEEAEKSKSFAELMSKVVKKEVNEDE